MQQNASSSSDESINAPRLYIASAEREICNRTLSRVALGRRRQCNRETCDIRQIFLKIKNGPEFGVVRNIFQNYKNNGIHGEQRMSCFSSCFHLIP